MYDGGCHFPPTSDSNREVLENPRVTQPVTGVRNPYEGLLDNAWPDEKSSYRTFNPDREFAPNDLASEEAFPNTTRTSTMSIPMRRTALILVGFITMFFLSWNWHLGSQSIEDREYREGFLETNKDFHVSANTDFDGTRILDLDTTLVPGGAGDPRGLRRLVFVGDIHGCADELKDLLGNVNFEPTTDHLIAVGDVISKGPDSAGVLDHLISINASSVRGNHEDRILAIAPSIDGAAPAKPSDPAREFFDSDPALLEQLSPDHLRYLHEMPLMLRIPPLPLAKESTHSTDSPIGEEILVVHAGLVPALSLEKQDPFFVMNMRAIHTKTHLPLVEAEAKNGKSKPWHDIWCWYNDRLFRHKSLKDFRVSETQPLQDVSGSGRFWGGAWLDWLLSQVQAKEPTPQVVIYGHRSKEGLKLERWSKGLDTACVKGGKLTALVLDAKGEQKIVQVKCKDYSA